MTDPQSEQSMSPFSRLATTAVIAALLGVALGAGITWMLTSGDSGAPSDGAAMEDGSADGGEEAAATYTCSMHPQVRTNEPGMCPI